MSTETKTKGKVKGMQFSTEDTVVNHLKFKPRVEDRNLCKATLVSVSLEMKDVPKVKEDGQENTSEFAGNTVPNLVFNFKQVPTTTDPAERYFTKRYAIPTTRRKDGTPLEEDIANSLMEIQWNQIMHIVKDGFKGVKGIELPKKSFNIDVFDTVAGRIKTFGEFYEFITMVLTGADDAAPAYQKVVLYVKLVAEYKYGKYLDFPNYIGTGFIQPFVKGVNPYIEISPKETVELKAGSTKKKSIAGADDVDAEEDADVARLLAEHGA